ncbi:hypothetical protein UlMin_006730 [Ulmus minor]
MSPTIFSGKWALIPARKLLSGVSFLVFLVLDFCDAILCVLYRFVDGFLEGKDSPCYCLKGEEQGRNVEGGDEEGEVSETLYGRKSFFRKLGLLELARKWEFSGKKDGGVTKIRWSDCQCECCSSWMSNDDLKLHVSIREPSKVTTKNYKGKPAENVIFLHGFMSSSKFWTETVFPNLSEPVKRRYRLFAVDLFGFGRSPKPRHSLYTLKDHMEMIEKSVISPYQLDSFHLVAHSMGCVVALALAAKHSKSVKSITLLAPPFFPSRDGDGMNVLGKVAGRLLWPPMLFGAAVMSWYEHIGRCVCFIVCRNHRIWEKMLKLFTWRSDLHFMIMDMTKHTHHSAWHSMHNVICGGIKFTERYFQVLSDARVKICVVQGDKDQVLPVECSKNIKERVPNVEVSIVRGANHSTIILGREKEFTRYLEHIWASLADS